MSKSDIYVCSSVQEGLSTATTEAVILGLPVVSTLVSGAEEILGKHNEYGIVTENSENGLYRGLRSMLTESQTLAHYRQKAAERAPFFNNDHTVKAVEALFENLCRNGGL
jgi:glycosyltransferase involved in cell wall biosynthesis